MPMFAVEDCNECFGSSYRIIDRRFVMLERMVEKRSCRLRVDAVSYHAMLTNAGRYLIARGDDLFLDLLSSIFANWLSRQRDTARLSFAVY